MQRKLERQVDPEEQQAIAAGMPRCPNCNGQNTRSSAPFGFQDAFLAMFRYYPYRCRVCQHRFYGKLPKHLHRPAA
jgi:hypothetical protein